MVQVENEISVADMDYSQVGSPRFYVQNEMCQPPKEKICNLGAAMVELRRVQAESATSQAQFMKEVCTPS